MKNVKGFKIRLLIITLPLVAGLWFANNQYSNGITAVSATASTTRQVNVPDVSTTPFEPAIFWFGGVTPTQNNADVRMWYHDTHIELVVHVIDRRLWYDTSPTTNSLSEWDAVSLFFNLSGNQGSAPTQDSYQIVTQLNANNGSASHKAAFRGSGTAWVETPLTYTVETSWRGDGGPNTNIDNKGWLLTAQYNRSAEEHRIDGSELK